MATEAENALERIRQHFAAHLGVANSDAAVERIRGALDALTDVDTVAAALDDPTPDHLTENGLVHYLTRNPRGGWWVTTRRDGHPYAGQPLDMFIAEDGVI